MDPLQPRIEGEGIENPLWLRHASTALVGNSTPLHSAVTSLDFTAVEALIHKGAQVNTADAQGNTPLILAAGSPREDAWVTIRALLEAGAVINDENKKGETALIAAARHGDLHRLTELLSAKGVDRGARDQDGRDAVMHAVLAGNAPAVAHLLDQQAPWDSVDNAGDQAIDFAFANKDKACCRAFWERGHFLNHVNSRHASPESPLTLCIGWEDLELMRRLVKEGTNPNIRHRGGLSAAHTAIEMKALEAFETLVDQGADPDARDDLRRTPLEIALNQLLLLHVYEIAQNSYPIRRICATGANPSLPMSDGEHPLLFSARHLVEIHRRVPFARVDPWRHVVEDLLECGSEPNVQDHNGDTALHHVGRLPMMKSELWGRLRRAGASKNIRNHRGRKPYLHFNTATKFFQVTVGLAVCLTVVGIPIGAPLLGMGLAACTLDKAQIGNFWLQRRVERR
ncbi:MAG: ankyrin repeat domain-containing protein [Chlamydiia bacterium]|nr:ankyrin repeat domain-containing protein [Chlamydiia bacterium]